MLEIEEAFNNCGQLHLKLHRTDSEAQFVYEIEKVVDEGKMYIKVCSDGIANYGYWVNGKWWSSNAEAINHSLKLIGTEWELEEGAVFSLDGYACGLTKRAFNRLIGSCDFSNLSTKEIVEILNSSLEKGNGDIMGETREMVGFVVNDLKRGKNVEKREARVKNVSDSKNTSGRVSFGEKFLKDFGLDVLENGELLQLVILDLFAECMVEIHKLAGNKFSAMSEEEVREFCFPKVGNTKFTTINEQI